MRSYNRLSQPRPSRLKACVFHPLILTDLLRITRNRVLPTRLNQCPQYLQMAAIPSHPYNPHTGLISARLYNSTGTKQRHAKNKRPRQRHHLF